LLERRTFPLSEYISTMTISFRNGVYGGAALTLVTCLFLLWLWQPERQVTRHAENLLRKIKGKNWGAVAAALASDYVDQWGDDRALVVARMREGLGPLRSIQINAAHPVVTVANGRGIWRARITIDGEDGEFLGFIQQRVNSIATPFELEWRQISRQPWDWKLASVRNPDLEVPGEF
jgi:hypothetical protein